MHIKIQTSSKANGNKGSANALASYLEKEDIMNENKAFEKGELPEPRPGFFDHHNTGVFKSEVIQKIDTNKKSLGREDAKFYALTISPSAEEQKHLLKDITKREINNINELNRKERAAYEKMLVDYTRKTMNEYASHFGRKDLQSGNQLRYYAKIEHQRFHKGTDPEVKTNQVKSGQKKEGLQTHVHIIMSRKDKEQRFKLSPLANEKNSIISKLNGKNVKRGFDRNLFNIKAETVFDKNFNYQRNLNEKVEFRIEADKDPIKASEIKNIRDPVKKQKLEKELINQYDFRNSYSKKDKELSQDIKPVLKKERDNELSI
ncbi:DUF5712 family protein [Aquimarina algiphila]|uniref:DUF5712 family protein n=1 Tax=Aquimarina algiphila TaxID=2047982 RepID=UPI00248FCD23|nr:DUF5712 family protein [Aquimarina algiphila]